MFCSRIPFSADMSINAILFISPIMMEINSCMQQMVERRIEWQKSETEADLVREKSKGDGKRQTDFKPNRDTITMLLNGLSGLERQEKKKTSPIIFIFYKTNICRVFVVVFFLHFILWLCAIGRFSLCMISRFPFDDYCHPAAALDVGTQNKHFSNGYISLCAKHKRSTA